MKRKLPKHVTAFYDRHGKERFRYRNGKVSRYLRGPFNSPEFKDDLKAARHAEPAPKVDRHAPGTIDDLITRYYQSTAFRTASAARQKTVRGIVEPFRAEYGVDLVRNFTFAHIEKIILDRSHRRKVGKREIGGPVAAVSLQKQLRRLFRYAVKLGLIQNNPAALAESFSAPKTGGWHTWTEAEIAKYRAKHTLGTKARLALEIILWTGQRRADASRFGRKHVKNGGIEFTAAKGQKVMRFPVAPQLQAAIDAMPTTGIETYLVTDFGKPYTPDGFGNKMRQWCDEAGLPHCTAHGLRKAIARRAAELEATQAMLKAIGGWEQDSEVATYTKGADQARLAEAVLSRLIEWERGVNNG